MPFGNILFEAIRDFIFMLTKPWQTIILYLVIPPATRAKGEKMFDQLTEPLRTDSLKDVFVLRFEELILSGKIKVGQKLPSERELALQLCVSRPVVHEGLVELASRGLVSLKPRIGATVNDYRKEGSISAASDCTSAAACARMLSASRLKSSGRLAACTSPESMPVSAGLRSKMPAARGGRVTGSSAAGCAVGVGVADPQAARNSRLMKKDN